MGADSRIKKKKIVFFDGVCNLCNKTVDNIIRHDFTSEIYFAPLQSQVALKTLSQFSINPEDLESIIFYEAGVIHQQSTAALEICKYLTGYKYLYFLKILPQSSRDFLYKIIARNRYKFFGRKNTCRIPTKEERERFLDS